MSVFRFRPLFVWIVLSTSFLETRGEWVVDRLYKSGLSIHHSGSYPKISPSGDYWVLGTNTGSGSRSHLRIIDSDGRDDDNPKNYRGNYDSDSSHPDYVTRDDGFEEIYLGPYTANGTPDLLYSYVEGLNDSYLRDATRSWSEFSFKKFTADFYDGPTRQENFERFEISRDFKVVVGIMSRSGKIGQVAYNI